MHFFVNIVPFCFLYILFVLYSYVFLHVFLSERCIFPCLFAICRMSRQIAVDERSFCGGYAKNQSVILSLDRRFLCLFACSASLV